ncbi:hypothetical protein J437_LFUL004697 [Ladona fulva]|uniref:Uncharacterized protein n=1 Tax=Ladona fulva TaxID=123851 RepID=A0A8K0KSU7_LADFU|nr:hypothetical protein J437_LFUL004697 [Ladona fulva]
MQKLQEEEEDIIRKELIALRMMRKKEEQKLLAENELIRQQHLAGKTDLDYIILKIVN